MGSKIDKEAARYRTRLDKTLADGKVTPQEADALIKDAKGGHFSEVEAHYLSGFVDRKLEHPLRLGSAVRRAASQMDAVLVDVVRLDLHLQAGVLALGLSGGHVLDGQLGVPGRLGRFHGFRDSMPRAGLQPN